MKNQKITALCNFLCAALLVVMLVMLFQPFWSCEDCKSHKDAQDEVSIAEFLWRPKQHDKLADDMTDYYKEIYGRDYRDASGKKFQFRANEILPSMLTAFLASAAGIICCVLLHKHFWVAAFPLVAGLGGILGFTTCPALRVGKNPQTYLMFSVIVSAVAAIALVFGAVTTILEKRRKREE